MTSSSFVSRRGKLAFDTNETIDNATETRDMKESSKGDEKGTKLTGVNRAYERTNERSDEKREKNSRPLYAQ